MVSLIKDAGGTYLFDEYEGNASYPVDIEKIYHKSINADIWIHTGMFNSFEQIINSDKRLKSFDELNKVCIFNNNKRSKDNGNDFYEKAAVHPELVLNDLINIFHHKNYDELYFYKEIKK